MAPTIRNIAIDEGGNMQIKVQPPSDDGGSRGYPGCAALLLGHDTTPDAPKTAAMHSCQDCRPMAPLVCCVNARPPLGSAVA